jgi:hypothetical protein
LPAAFDRGHRRWRRARYPLPPRSNRIFGLAWELKAKVLSPWTLQVKY